MTSSDKVFQMTNFGYYKGKGHIAPTHPSQSNNNNLEFLLTVLLRYFQSFNYGFIVFMKESSLEVALQMSKSKATRYVNEDVKFSNVGLESMQYFSFLCDFCDINIKYYEIYFMKRLNG